MYIKKRVVCIISILILLFSCNFENQSTQKVVYKIIEENPPTISWSSSEELEVRSVEADVTVYSINNKKSNETKIMYDVANETLSQIETIDVLEDGTKVTTTVYEMYEESEGEMIKIGSVTVVNSEAATLLPGFEDVEYFESIEEIPEISETEYEELVEKGSVEVIEDMNFGNPADMSYEEVIVEMYSNIEINSVEDASFRILLSE